MIPLAPLAVVASLLAGCAVETGDDTQTEPRDVSARSSTTDAKTNEAKPELSLFPTESISVPGGVAHRGSLVFSGEGFTPGGEVVLVANDASGNHLASGTFTASTASHLGSTWSLGGNLSGSITGFICPDGDFPFVLWADDTTTGHWVSTNATMLCKFP
jgi:hypothetical protein